MTRLCIPVALICGLVVAPASAQRRQQNVDPGVWQAAGTHGAVAAGGQGAVDAGITLLKEGGNAMDAAAATILALSVTDSTAFCFGGEVPILVYDAKRGVVEVLCGLGTAPQLATQKYFDKPGGIPGRGIEPAAVPGAFDACLTMLDRFGTKTFAEAVAPTLKLLDRGGQEWHADLAKTLRSLIDAEKGSGGDRRRGLRLVADYFYRGPVAREIDAWSRENGGLIRYTDLATHVTRVEEPVTTTYRGYTVCKAGVWTQGPYLLQTLKLLEGFDLKPLGHNKPETIHLEAEALKLALADRDAWFADPLFIDVPLNELMSSSYVQLRRGLIDPKHASLVRRPGDPRAGKVLQDNPDLRSGPGGPSQDTTTCLVADGAGNVVAATPSGFSGVVAGKTGVKLGTRLQSNNNWAGHSNCIEPGKRPRITLTPTIVMKDGKPVIAVSVAGGDMQDQATLQLLTSAIDFGLSPAEAVRAPRFGTNHHLGSFRQKAPELGSLILSPEMGSDVVNALADLGHKVTSRRPSEASVMIRIDPQTGVLRAAGDPRARRHAGAY
jgi:gamma-glutamyltranspeptidase/glutathione hydrolase